MIYFFKATLPSELMHELEVEVMSSMANVRGSASKTGAFSHISMEMNQAN